MFGQHWGTPYQAPSMGPSISNSINGIPMTSRGAILHQVQDIYANAHCLCILCLKFILIWITCILHIRHNGTPHMLAPGTSEADMCEGAAFQPYPMMHCVPGTMASHTQQGSQGATLPRQPLRGTLPPMLVYQ